MKYLLILVLAAATLSSAQCPVKPDPVFVAVAPGNRVYLDGHWLNQSSKVIKAVKFSVAELDAMGDAHPLIYTVIDQGKVKPGKRGHVTSEGIFLIPWEKYQLAPVEVLYEDGVKEGVVAACN